MIFILLIIGVICIHFYLKYNEIEESKKLEKTNKNIYNNLKTSLLNELNIEYKK